MADDFGLRIGLEGEASFKAALDNASSSFGENDKRTQNWWIRLSSSCRKG